MKKAKKKLTFASSVFAAGAMLGLTGCPVNAGVYGPPQSDPQPDVYGPPSFVEDNIDDPEVCVYGPPEYFEDDTDVPVTPVYGPPEDVDEPIEEVYGPPEDFEYDGSIESSIAPDEQDGKEQSGEVNDPEDDLNAPMVVVYGPPEP